MTRALRMMLSCMAPGYSKDLLSRLAFATPRGSLTFEHCMAGGSRRRKASPSMVAEVVASIVDQVTTLLP